jgi:hypothetical protein
MFRVMVVVMRDSMFRSNQSMFHRFGHRLVRHVIVRVDALTVEPSKHKVRSFDDRHSGSHKKQTPSAQKLCPFVFKVFVVYKMTVHVFKLLRQMTPPFEQ